MSKFCNHKAVMMLAMLFFSGCHKNTKPIDIIKASAYSKSTMVPTPLNQERNQVNLEFFQNVLKKMGVDAQVSQLSGKYDSLSLTAELSNNYFLQLMYVPIGEVLQETDLLQFYGHHAVLIEVTPDVEEFVAYINRQSPLGQFSFNDSGYFYHRYIHALHRYNVPNEESFGEVAEFFVASLKHFSQVLTDISTGQIDLQGAISELSQ